MILFKDQYFLKWIFKLLICVYKIREILFAHQATAFYIDVFGNGWSKQKCGSLNYQ